MIITSLIYLYQWIRNYLLEDRVAVANRGTSPENHRIWVCMKSGLFGKWVPASSHTSVMSATDKAVRYADMFGARVLPMTARTVPDKAFKEVEA